MAEIVYREESYAIIGACFEVYKEIGSGFLEPVYQECLSVELTRRDIPFREQVHNYLKASSYRLGLLVNFSHYPKLQYERIVI